jgi:hypothetical protein
MYIPIDKGGYYSLSKHTKNTSTAISGGSIRQIDLPNQKITINEDDTNLERLRGMLNNLSFLKNPSTTNKGGSVSLKRDDINYIKF